MKSTFERTAGTLVPLVLDVNTPAWVQSIPDDLLEPNDSGRMMHPVRLRQLLKWLDNRGLPRPTLFQVESERRRRWGRRHP